MNDLLPARLKATIPPHTFVLLTRAAGLANERGWRLYLVAGYIRDCLLDLPLHDLDITVVGDALQVAEEMARLVSAGLETFEQFGTATLRLVGDLDIDLVTARKESYPRPGALPVVEAGDIFDDLARRDFSVNAMAVELTPAGLGQLLDPHDGLRDLGSHSIRVLHDLSFRDDPTRIFRSVKFARRLDFIIEKQTLELILQAVRDGVLYTISTDRITRELLLILEEPQADAMLWDLDRFGVLRAIHTLLAWPYEPGKIRPGPDKALTPQERSDTYLAVLGAETGTDPEEAEKLARWLNLPAPHVKLMRDAARLAGLWPKLGEDIQSSWQTYSLLRDLDVRTLQAYARLEALQADSVASSRLKLYIDTLRHVKPELKGDFLASLGERPGPFYRKLLEGLLEAKIEGRVPTRADEERFVRERLAERE